RRRGTSKDPAHPRDLQCHDPADLRPARLLRDPRAARHRHDGRVRRRAGDGLRFPRHRRTHGMTPLHITALTAVSALGRGAVAHGDALLASRTGLRPNDFDPVAGGWIGRVDGLEEHRLAADLARFECRNNRLADIALHTDGFADRAADARARYGAHRIALVLGTS